MKTAMMNNELKDIAITGNGPTTIYLLKNIHLNINSLKERIESITIFEKEKVSSMGT